MRTAALTVPPARWAAARTAERSRVDHRDPPSRAGSPQERARGRGRWGKPAGGRHRGPQRPAGVRGVPDRVQASGQGVVEQASGRWRWARERPRRVFRMAVREAGEHREASDPVGDDVVQDDDHRHPSVGQSGDHLDHPQRRGSGQRAGHRGRDGVQQGPLVAGRWAHRPVYVVPDVEGLVVHPDRSAASQRGPDQALSQAGDRPDPSLDHGRHDGRVQGGVGFQEKDGRHVGRHGAAVHRQERAVTRAGPVDGSHGYSRPPRVVPAPGHEVPPGRARRPVVAGPQPSARLSTLPAPFFGNTSRNSTNRGYL